MLYILNIYYFFFFLNGLSSQKKTWRMLKYIQLSEISQCDEAAHCLSPTTWPPGKIKTRNTE